MNRTTPLMNSETYHIFNRGAHKYNVFTNDADYLRFTLLLYLSNSIAPTNMRDLFAKYKGRTFVDFFGLPRSDGLVDILAYSLMPNHYHLVLKQKKDRGITNFMKKVSIGYSMYFNTKYGHGGVLFQGRFKSNHLDTDPYFKWIFPYIHLNPISLVEPEWREKGISKPARSMEFLRNYSYSSYYDYYVGERPEREILAYDEANGLLDKEADIHGMLAAYTKGRMLFPAVERQGVGI